MIVYQIGGLITGETPFTVFTGIAIVLLAALVYLLIRPYKESRTLEVDLKEDVYKRQFLECVSRCRLREAERQLLFTPESNAGICKACGFSDSKYFYRNFQQEFQMTPSQWKRDVYKRQIIW